MQYVFRKRNDDARPRRDGKCSHERRKLGKIEFQKGRHERDPDLNIHQHRGKRGHDGNNGYRIQFLCSFMIHLVFLHNIIKIRRKKYFFDGFCKPSHKKTTKATKENKKIDNDARRKIGKHYGFKQASYCNWIIKENYFFYVQYNQYPYFDNVEYYVKPCYFDDILLDEINIWEQKSTLSDRAIVVSAPSFMLSRTDLPSHKDEEFSAETRERVWLGIFMKAQQLIDVFLSQNQDVDAFEFESLGLNSDDNDLASMLQMLHHQQYEKVIALATSLIEKGKKGYLSWLRTDENGDVKSKSLYDYVIEYSRRKNSISFQSAAESQKIK